MEPNLASAISALSMLGIFLILLIAAISDTVSL